MGMYTGLRARVKIKPEYRSAIQKLHDNHCNDYIDEDGWDSLDHNEIPNLSIWKAITRRNFIPFGGLAYMPDGFEQPFTDCGGSKFDGEWWTFSCSLKNYNNEIGTFTLLILKEIVEEIDYCQRLYEESYTNDSTWMNECINYTLENMNGN